MAVYRITGFTAPDMDKAAVASEDMRAMLEGVGADFIDVVSLDNGKGVVVAKYPDAASMENAADTAKKVFGKMIEAGFIDGSSLDIQTGEVVNSF